MEEKEIAAGQLKWVVDCWGCEDGMRAIVARAKILEVTDQHIVAVLHGDTYQAYQKSDCGNLIFDNEIDATIAANKLPRPGTVVYRISGNGRILKRTIWGVTGYHNAMGMYELFLKTGQDVCYPISDLGKKIFPKYEDAKDYMRAK